jgi:hypothetical protein
MTDPYGDRFRLLILRRMFARDNLPGWKTAGPDTGIVHGPETRAASTLEGMRRVDNALLTGGMRAAFGWDAVPDTRDVRPEPNPFVPFAERFVDAILSQPEYRKQ